MRVADQSERSTVLQFTIIGVHYPANDWHLNIKCLGLLGTVMAAVLFAAHQSGRVRTDK